MIEDLVWQTVIGRKTQTRRTGGLESVNISLEESGKEIETSDRFELVRYNDTHAKFVEKHNTLNEIYCRPRYGIGENLYIKEPILNKEWRGYTRTGNPTNYYYDVVAHDRDRELKQFSITKSNKLFMAERQARFHVRITGIKCERLLDISDEDCEAEGIAAGGCTSNGEWHIHGWRDYSVILRDGTDTYDIYDFPPNDQRGSFLSLFRFANKIPQSQSIGNPWVWAYTYEFLNNYK